MKRLRICTLAIFTKIRRKNKMSYTWFTSDMHFNHYTSEERNILKYCSRPFSTVEEMNEKLIQNWNNRVGMEDTVYHVGDFCFKGGGCGKKSAQYWESLLNGKIIYVKGNHDVNNSTKSIMTCALLEFGNKIALCIHVPPTMRLEIPDFCDFVICGHVHEKWKVSWIEDIPLINIGTDAWNYKPVRMDELLGYYNHIQKTK